MTELSRREARNWLVRLHSDAARGVNSLGLRAAFDAWRGSDPNNANAWEEICQADDALDAVRALAAEMSVSTFKETMARNVARRRLLRGGVGAALIVGAAALGVRLLGEAPVQAFATGRGEHRRVTLGDGSELELNTSTRVEARLSLVSRKLLLTSGEAFFQVAHEPLRPFEVDAGPHRVRATGTAFAVRYEPPLFHVLVSEGRIEADIAEAHGVQHCALEAPARLALVSGRAALTPLSQAQAQGLLAWRSGEVRFLHIRLGDAAREMQRYSDVTFRFSDPALENLDVVLRTRTSDVDTFAATLQTSNPTIEVVRTGNVYLVRRRA